LNAVFGNATLMLVQEQMVILCLRAYGQPCIQHSVPTRREPHHAFFAAFAPHPQLHHLCLRPCCAQTAEAQLCHFFYPQTGAHHQTEHGSVSLVVHHIKKPLYIGV
jgi:hypothetical protein